MGRDYKVIFGQRCRKDLQEIVSYVRDASGSPEAAERLGMALINKALTLSSLPDRGRVVPELDLSEVREIIFKSYRIVYRVAVAEVQVLRFWHAARGVPEINIDEFTR